MLADALRPRRRELLKFSSEFKAHLEVGRLHRRGLRVPPTHIVATYVGALEQFDLSDKTRAHAARLRSRAVTCKKWGRAFRQRWHLEWGAGHATRGVSDQDVQMRVAVFLRWVCWVHAELSKNGSPIIVNTDETMLSSVSPLKLFVVPDLAKTRELRLGRVGRDTPLPRTSLLAAVCSDGDLQKVLPQMRMPRAMGQGGVAGRTARAVYASAGQPQCTLHE